MQFAALVAIHWRTSLAAGFPLDDAWIHQVVARNLAETGMLGVAPGRFGSGATSIVWALLMTPDHVLLHLPPSLYAAVVGSLCFVISGQMVLLLASMGGWRAMRAWMFAALFSVGPNYAWFALSGMEPCLVTALLVTALVLFFRGSRSLRSGLTAGFFLAVLVWTRPENALVCGVFLFLARPAARPWKQVLFILGIPFCALLAYGVATQWGAGSAGPTTLAGRRWMWTQEGTAWPWYELSVGLVEHWLDRLWAFTVGRIWLPAFWLLVGAALLGVVRVWRTSKPIAALVITSGVQILSYLVLLPTEGHGGRYQPFVAALFLPLAFEGGRALLASLLSARLRARQLEGVATYGIPVLLLVPLLSSYASWSKAHALAIEHINATEVATGRFLASLPSGVAIASFDIGGIMYFSRRPVLDLGGLTDPSVMGDIRAGTLAHRLNLERIRVLVMPAGYDESYVDPWSFQGRLGLVGKNRPPMQKIAEFASQEEVWAPGLSATLHCAPRQIVYLLGAIGDSP